MRTDVGNTLNAGQKLLKGDALTSDNGAYTLTLAEDGNLVLAARGKTLWSTGTDGKGIDRAELQGDGNFVLYAGDKPLWHTDTAGKKDVRLTVQDDRNVVLYSGKDAAWSTKTNTDAPPPPAEEAAPAAEAAPEAAPAPAAQRKYTIAPGDTLWAIAERFYGDGSKFPKIAEANGIANPDLINAGAELVIPE